MAKYWYRIRLSRAVKAEEVEDLKSELVRLFQSADVPVADEKTFNVTTALEPAEAGAALDRFSVNHGGASLVAGGKIE
jgi:hypothetical protein